MLRTTSVLKIKFAPPPQKKKKKKNSMVPRPSGFEENKSWLNQIKVGTNLTRVRDVLLKEFSHSTLGKIIQFSSVRVGRKSIISW